jgi:hypothetical protein
MLLSLATGRRWWGQTTVGGDDGESVRWRQREPERPVVNRVHLQGDGEPGAYVKRSALVSGVGDWVG